MFEGNSEIVQRMLNNGAEVDWKDDFGRTPMHYAVEQGNIF